MPTDAIMTEMNGKEMVDCRRSLRPDLTALFVSGYTPESLVRRGVVQKGAHCIRKPPDRDERHGKIGRIPSARGCPTPSKDQR